jgi:hypothetical protein
MRLVLALGVCCLIAAVVIGCNQRDVDQALESDANGYVCEKCQAKFYTEREVFPGHCPACKNPKPEMVLGYVCADDQFVTLAPRGRGSAKCGQCGKTATAMSIPRESELKQWGADKKTAKEVGG